MYVYDSNPLLCSFAFVYQCSIAYPKCGSMLSLTFSIKYLLVIVKGLTVNSKIQV
jgi:hypothetical protein